MRLRARAEETVAAERSNEVRLRIEKTERVLLVTFDKSHQEKFPGTHKSSCHL